MSGHDIGDSLNDEVLQEVDAAHEANGGSGFKCKKYEQMHFGLDDDESNHCRFCDGPHTAGSIMTRNVIRAQRDAALDPSVYESLRDYLPPPLPVGTPMGAGIGGRMPRYPTMPRPRIIRSAHDLGNECCGPGMYPDDIGEEFGNPPTFPIHPDFSPGRYRRPPRYKKPGLRDRLARLMVEWAIGYLERKLDEAYDLKHELAIRAGELAPGDFIDPMPFDPGAYPGPWMSPLDVEYPEFEEERSFANRLYCGVFGKGGIGNFE